MGNISSYKLLLKENFHVTNAIVGDQVGSILAATEREREKYKRKKKNKKETKEEGNVATRDINGGRRGRGLSRKKRREPL